MKTVTKLFTLFTLLLIFLTIAPLPVAHTASAAGNSLRPAVLGDVGTHMTDGVTIITHGWNPGMAGAPTWPASMRAAIAVNFLGNEQNFGTITVTKSGPSLVATCNPWDVDLTSKTTGGIVIVLDWSAVADHLNGGPAAQDVVAVVVDKIVTGQNGKKPLAELPIHIVGHSRGGGLVAELAHQLGERGVVVDQLTMLDPHPLTTADPQPVLGGPVIDTPVAVYENVVFADNYWQNSESPTGQTVGNAYNRLWGNMPGGYYDTVSPVYPNHRNIYLMYQGSVDLGNPVNNGEASMDATERAAWFNAYENSGDNTGFTYSRLDGGGDRTSATTPVAGGDAIRAGLSSDAAFGGGGARSNLAWSLAVWPNLAQLDVLASSVALGSGAHPVTIGATLQLHYVYLDYDSGGTVTLHADADRNPYNGNDITVISTQPFAAATGKTYTQNTVGWDTSAMTSGTTAYVYAKVTDSARTRYLYAAPALQFQGANSAPTDITLSAASVAENQLAGTTVGTLTTTDADAGDTHTYAFACAAPGADDASFAVAGNALNTAAVFDYETKNSYSICLRTNDGRGGTFDKAFTITVTDVNETLTATFRSVGAYDGWILEKSESANTGGTLDAKSTTLRLGDEAADKQYRAILSFDTKTLPDAATVTKVTLKIKRPTAGFLIGNNNPFTWGLGLKADACKNFFGTGIALQLADFNANSTANCKLLAGTFGNTPAASWYSANIVNTAFAKINKTGVTQFRLRFAKDDNDDNLADYLKFYSGDSSANSPQLVIEYTVP